MIPRIYDYPVRRPGFLLDVQWIGQQGADELALQLTYPNQNGINESISLHTLTASNATLCLPTSKGITDISDDIFTAHLRMAGMVAGAIPGSNEYADVLVDSGALDAKNYQMPIGDVKCTNIVVVNDIFIDATFQKGSGALRTVRMGIVDLATYSFAPSTQLAVIAGSVKKQFPTYYQDSTQSKFLTQTQMDDIRAYVLSQAPWV